MSKNVWSYSCSCTWSDTKQYIENLRLFSLKELSVLKQSNVNAGASKTEIFGGWLWEAWATPYGLSNPIIRYLNDHPFLWARLFTKPFATDRQKSKTFLLQDLELRKFSRRPLPHKFRIAQEQKGVIKAREVLKSLREHVDPNFATEW
jgi:hypothetical protein